MQDKYIVIDKAKRVINAGVFPGEPAMVIAAESERGNEAIFGIDGADKVGWTYLKGAGAFISPNKSRDEIKAEIADLRWQREVGGTVWLGRPVNTQRDAVSMLAGAIMQGETQSVWPLRWKFNDGQFYDMTATDFQQLGLAVRAHINAAFAWEDAELARLASTPDDQLKNFALNV